MTIARLERTADEARLQRFLERCSDYYVLHEGWPTPPDAAAYELTTVPDGRSVDDLHVLGMAAADGELTAVAQLLRDYPRDGAWWIALLVVAPELRGAGAGVKLVEHMVEVVRGAGGGPVYLAVSVKNPRGQAFWEKVGFVETGRLMQVTARSGHVDEVRILSRSVAGALT